MLPPRPIAEIIASTAEFSGSRVLVVGDLFLDEYIEGEMVGISKEGPIPVLKHRSRVTAAGAAGNLASSIRNLGAQVSVVGVVGDDANGAALLAELQRKGIDTRGVLIDPRAPTLKYGKIRAFVESAPSREILRLDVLPEGPIRPELEAEILRRVEAQVAFADGVIVLDQVRYLITPRLLDRLPDLARLHGAFLQGSSREHLADFHDFDLVVPNDREARIALGALGLETAENAGVEDLGVELRRQGRHRQVLLTLGPEGMAVFSAVDSPPSAPAPSRRIPTLARDVVDVTGAGDAVASTVVLGMLAGWDLTTAAWTASHAAAIAIAHVGTHHVTLAELTAALVDSEASTG
jgi:rfaE bifunctional protein kinase chain/domain